MGNGDLLFNFIPLYTALEFPNNVCVLLFFKCQQGLSGGEIMILFVFIFMLYIKKKLFCSFEWVAHYKVQKLRAILQITHGNLPPT